MARGGPESSDLMSGLPPGVRTDGTHFIPFQLDGRPATIEPLPDCEESGRLLLKGRERRLVTAVAVGEAGDHDVPPIPTPSWSTG